jgi:hypothetical protein
MPITTFDAIKKQLAGTPKTEVANADENAVLQDARREVTPSGFAGGRGRDESGQPAIIPTGAPPVQTPMTAFASLPKDATMTPGQFERYTLTFSTNSGRVNTGNAAFPIHTIQVDNYTSIYVFLPIVQRWIPPYTFGVQMPVIAGTGIIEAIAEPPPGTTQPALASTIAPLQIAVYEDCLSYSPGFSLQGGAGGGTVAVSGTLTANPADLGAQVTAFLTMQNAATSNGNGTVATVDGYNGAQQVEVAETAGGTCTLAIQGSFDNTNFYAVGYQQVDNTTTPARSVGNISVAASTRHVYQILDPYKYLRTVISAIAGGGTVTTKVYLEPA